MYYLLFKYILYSRISDGALVMQLLMSKKPSIVKTIDVFHTLFIHVPLALAKIHLRIILKMNLSISFCY